MQIPLRIANKLLEILLMNYFEGGQYTFLSSMNMIVKWALSVVFKSPMTYGCHKEIIEYYKWCRVNWDLLRDQHVTYMLSD